MRRKIQRLTSLSGQIGTGVILPGRPLPEDVFRERERLVLETGVLHVLPQPGQIGGEPAQHRQVRALVRRRRPDRQRRAKAADVAACLRGGEFGFGRAQAVPARRPRCRPPRRG